MIFFNPETLRLETISILPAENFLIHKMGLGVGYLSVYNISINFLARLQKKSVQMFIVSKFYC